MIARCKHTSDLSRVQYENVTCGMWGRRVSNPPHMTPRRPAETQVRCFWIPVRHGGAVSKIYGAGFQPLVPSHRCKPGASPPAGMRTRFQCSTCRFEYGFEGRRPDSYQPGATRQVRARITGARAEGPLHRTPRQRPRRGRAFSAPYLYRNTAPRAEGPIHTSLAQRARYRSDNTLEG